MLSRPDSGSLSLSLSLGTAQRAREAAEACVAAGTQIRDAQCVSMGTAGWQRAPLERELRTMSK